MKNKIIAINRDEWEKLREFRKIPYKQRYFEILEIEHIAEKQIDNKLLGIH